MVRHYWRIYRTFFKSSFARELQFRANFIAKMLQNTVWFGFFLVVLFVVYANVKTIAGWDRREAQILGATLYIVSSLNNLLAASVLEIPGHVRQGTLDFIVTKPVDSQFWISMRKFNFSELGSFLGGIVLVSISMFGLHPSFEQVALYLVGIVCAVANLYGFQLMLMTTGIYFIRVDNLWVLGETLSGLGRYPMDIYPTGLRYLLTFILPVAFFAYFPALQLVRTPSYTIALEAIGLAIIFFFLSRFWWRYSMKHYSSASS
jgi:ABC-2 type transport system permease protein